MKVLLVEDDQMMVTVLTEAFEGTNVELLRVDNRDGAVAAIEMNGPFELVICDLRIPPAALARDADLAHGLAVCDHILANAPGTPIIVFSAFGSLEILGRRLAHCPTADIVGRERWPLLDQVDKGKLEEFTDRVIGLATEIEALHDEVEMTWGGHASPLSRLEERSILIYARRRNGAVVRARLMAGGRSSAKTLRLDIEGLEGQLVSRVLAKINSLAALGDEKRRYDDFVSPLLPAGRYAAWIEDVRAGAGDRGAAIYSLAGGEFNSTFFEALGTSGSNGTRTVEILRQATAPWLDAKQTERVKVGVIRADLIPNEKFDPERPRLGAAPVENVEAQDVHIFRAPAHGDLHGGNVLVDAQGTPLLIDFGSVGPAPASLDPVTLELSVVLHPDAGVDLRGWPSVSQAENWSSLDDYLDECPVAEFVQSCRRWAHEVARGDREVLTSAYAYAARQLQYSTVDQELAIAYAKGAVARLAS